MTSYPVTVHARLQEGVRKSAEVIVPLVMDRLSPKSVVDVGCGLGTWLSVFQECGVEEILGIDSADMNGESLEIPQERFLSFDLREPLRLERRFDLVVSVEVAEHLPQESAATFVESLTRLGPVVLFSAAIPFQEGWQHVNEQWPDYWTEHFRRKGFTAVDGLRQEIWSDPGVQWWYCQNLLLFVEGNVVSKDIAWNAQCKENSSTPLPLVHPRKYLDMAQKYKEYLDETWQLRSKLAERELYELIPPGEAFVLVDQNKLGTKFASRYQVVPFLSREGKYWGPPPDDVVAIAELRKLNEVGLRLIVFAWPAFWWLDYYTDFARLVRSKYRLLLKNDRLMLFDMGGRSGI